MSRTRWLLLTLLLLLPAPVHAQALAGTKLLEGKDDFAKLMVDGIGKWLDRETAAAAAKRKALWKMDFSSPEAYITSVHANRERFKKIIGVVDRRLPVKMEYVATTEQPALVAEHKLYKVHAVRWPVLPGVDGEGLLLEPTGKVKANVIAIPDADQTPEFWAGFEGANFRREQVGRVLAQNGCRVLIPTLVNRQDTYSGSPKLPRQTNQPHREFVYRMAYQMGRHIIGYEVQKILAGVDWFAREKGHAPIAVCGYGEGGLLAFYSAACDQRIQVTGVCGYSGERLDEAPIYRNVWTLLREFGEAEVAALIAPRHLIEEVVPGPEVKGPPAARKDAAGAAPGSLGRYSFGGIQGAADLSFKPLKIPERIGHYSNQMVGRPGSAEWYWAFLGALGWDGKAKIDLDAKDAKSPRDKFDPAPRQKRQVDQLVGYTQKLLPEAAAKREEFFWKKLDTSSLEKFQKSQEPLCDCFAKEIIGELPQPTKPINPRTRKIYETDKYTGYEVVLDLYDDVICHGILLVPKDLKPNEKRPVVVCQHGLEGRPDVVCDPNKKTVYNAFGAQLAERGFIVFAPQNPYIFENQFRQLVRKGNPLGLTLYAFIVRQHERILDWLTSLPFVDGSRIAFYGLSYGGKVAMRIPVLIGRYAVVICSGDFNEWIWKNITLDWIGSYMFTREYEMYEFDLGNTFNYAEMAALIAPRPFMVERGHHDGVGLDEYVAFEYAKVRRFYTRLGIPERTEIEFFNGGHEIHGQGTFAFLHRHLKWPAPK